MYLILFCNGFLFLLRTYIIIAPARVYPNMVVQVSVTIFELYQSHMNVRGSIRKDGEEYASFITTFTEPSTRLMQMRVRV